MVFYKNVVEATMTNDPRNTSCGILIPHYNTPNQLHRLLDRIPSTLHQNVLVVDDGSHNPPKNLPCAMIKHASNKGYGASQKTGFLHFLYEPSLSHIMQVAMVHGDDQYHFDTIWSACEIEAPIKLGSRYLSPDPSIKIPIWRKWGNHMLTQIANKQFGTQYTDLHTGARIYHGGWLENVDFTTFSDDFVFDHQMLVAGLIQQMDIIEFPLPANYDEGVSSISFSRSVKYGVGCVQSLWAAKRAKF